MPENLTTKDRKRIDKIITKSRKKTTKRQWRFSERIIFLVLIFAIGVFCSSIVYSFVKNDGSVWAYLIPSIGVLASSAFAVFVWKEKNENLPKIKANPSYDEDKMREEITYEVQEEYKNLGR